MTSTHITPDGDHEVIQGVDGIWRVTVVGDADVLYESESLQECLEAVAEVVADMMAT